MSQTLYELLVRLDGTKVLGAHVLYIAETQGPFDPAPKTVISDPMAVPVDSLGEIFPALNALALSHNAALQAQLTAAAADNKALLAQITDLQAQVKQLTPVVAE